MREPEDAKTPDVRVRCAKCGGTNVQHAMWVSLNEGDDGCIVDTFGSWCDGDNSWCNDCDEPTQLVDRDGGFPEDFRAAAKLAREREAAETATEDTCK